MGTFVYELKDSLYINLTNRCNNSCVFCIKFKNRVFENKYDLWLSAEPSADDIKKLVSDSAKYSQVVFCGYGEPLVRLAQVIELSKYFKEKGLYVRIDTDGLANLFYGRDVIPQIAHYVDELDISLNAQDSGTYRKLCRPLFGDKAFKAVLDFAGKASKAVPKVVLTAVALPGVDEVKCAKIAADLGCGFKLRPYYEGCYVDTEKGN